MPTKQILVLANSYKKPDRCVAGLEIVDGQPLRKKWIRPISTLDNGGLSREQIVLNDGGIPAVLDLVELPLIEHAGDAAQPENWYFAPKVKWKRVGKLTAKALDPLLEAPPGLWKSVQGKSDRVASDELKFLFMPWSLTLIRPEQLRIKVIGDEAGLNDTVKARAIFRYRRLEYDLSLTDPIFQGRYCKNVLPMGKTELEFAPPFGDRCALCVSLTPPFQGHHYKVVATILELPA